MRDLVNNTRNNTISEISAKKGLNTLNKVKNAEIIKHKKYTPKQKELLNLFDNLLDVILTDETLMSSKYENENENENDKPLINTTNKKENQIIVNNINKNLKKLCEMDPFNNFVIQPSAWRVDLIDAINLILEFNEKI